ncbi:MAG: DMT family transporter [Rhodospirillales bacterium]|nr:DMT family transporter [Rhodospirillales bacterium]MSP80088.1 DMT family transporter [Rhodospirillales bacterium]
MQTFPTPARLPVAGFVLLAAVTLVWGVNWPLMKIGLGTLPPFTFRAAMVPASGLLILGLAFLAGQRLGAPRAAWPPLLVSALFNVTLWHAFSAFGIAAMESGRASVIAFTMPLWAAILARLFLAEAIGGRRGLALALGAGGVGTLLYPDFARFAATPQGPLLMSGAAIVWAAGTLWQKRIGCAMPVLAHTGWQLFLGGLPLVAAAFVFEAADGANWSLPIVILVAYNIVGPLGFCYWAWYKVVALFPAHVAAIGTLLIPVVGVASGAAILGEPFGWPELMALALVTGALALTLTERRVAAQK